MDIIQSQFSKPQNIVLQWLSARKYTIWYVLALGIIALLWKLVAGGKITVIWFFCSQILFLILGAVHVYLLDKTIPWNGKYKFWNEALWTILMTAFSVILLSKIVSFSWVGGGTTTTTFFLSALSFSLPFFFTQAYKFWNAIPEKTWKAWQYPFGMEPPVIYMVGHEVVMNLDLLKEGDKFHPITIKLDMNKSLGEHLHFIIYNYNLNPKYGKIILTADPVTNEPYSCRFYVKPWKLWWGRVLDFNAPVKELGLKTNWTIQIQTKQINKV